jgi:hypothetical protein
MKENKININKKEIYYQSDELSKQFDEEEIESTE